MLRSCLICAGILALVLPSARGEEGVPTLKTLEQQQKDLLTKLNLIQNDIASLKERLDRMESNKSTLLDSYDVKLKLEELHADILKLHNELNASRRSTSAFNPMPQLPNEPPAKRSESLKLSSGTVRLTNDFLTTQHVIVNGLNYSIVPGETRDIPVQAGDFTYQIWGLDVAPRVSSVPAGMLKAIRIFVQ
jgi:hypothetical protein